LWTPNQALHVGEVLDVEAGGYTVVDFIGRGGVGEVYRVRDEAGAPFAIKVLQLQHLGNPKASERMRVEAEAFRALQHQNVVRIHAGGIRDDGLVWIVMDLLTGWSLREVLLQRGKVQIPFALKIIGDACLGLGAVHQLAIHRDIKPENIHFDTRGVTRVVDFGTAKFSRHGVKTSGTHAAGTVPYMSPEQLRALRDLDVRSDLFSLGIVLYEMITGHHPFLPKDVSLIAAPDEPRDGRSLMFLVGDAIIRKPHPPVRDYQPLAPLFLQEILDCALSKDKEDRFSNAAEMASVLEGAYHRVAYDYGSLPPVSVFCDLLIPGRGSTDVAPTDVEPQGSFHDTDLEPATSPETIAVPLSALEIARRTGSRPVPMLEVPDADEDRYVEPLWEQEVGPMFRDVAGRASASAVIVAPAGSASLTVQVTQQPRSAQEPRPAPRILKTQKMSALDPLPSPASPVALAQKRKPSEALGPELRRILAEKEAVRRQAARRTALRLGVFVLGLALLAVLTLELGLWLRR
jgi:serine/threonine protein kinase